MSLMSNIRGEIMEGFKSIEEARAYSDEKPNKLAEQEIIEQHIRGLGKKLFVARLEFIYAQTSY